MTNQPDEKQRWLKVEIVVEFWGQEIRVPLTISSPSVNAWDGGRHQSKCDRALIDQIIATNLNYGGVVKEVVLATKEEMTRWNAIEASNPVSGTKCHDTNSNAS